MVTPDLLELPAAMASTEHLGWRVPQDPQEHPEHLVLTVLLARLAQLAQSAQSDLLVRLDLLDQSDLRV